MHQICSEPIFSVSYVWHQNEISLFFFMFIFVILYPWFSDVRVYNTSEYTCTCSSSEWNIFIFTFLSLIFQSRLHFLTLQLHVVSFRLYLFRLFSYLIHIPTIRICQCKSDNFMCSYYSNELFLSLGQISLFCSWAFNVCA